MTVNELIRALELCRNEIGGETPVRIATQPNYPLAFEIDVVSIDGEGEDVDESTVWIGTGDHPGYPYAPEYVWENSVV